MCLTNVLSKQFVHFKIQRINEIIVTKTKLPLLGFEPMSSSMHIQHYRSRQRVNPLARTSRIAIYIKADSITLFLSKERVANTYGTKNWRQSFSHPPENTQAHCQLPDVQDEGNNDQPDQDLKMWTPDSLIKYTLSNELSGVRI